MIEEFKRKYFDGVYNPIYDFTTARSNRYLRLQARCIGLLAPAPGDSVLCAGLGTGNEIPRLLEFEADLRLTGIDYSPRALARARQKADRLGVTLELHDMDVCAIDLPDDTFDRVLCLHVADFVERTDQMVAEIQRVLKPGGRYVVTFPSDSEGVRMGLGILRDHLSQYHGLGKLAALLKYIAIMPLGLLYLPLMLRSGKRVYSGAQLAQLFGDYGDREVRVEAEPIYHDYIVCGIKSGAKEE
jgi:ubiquinone/menaquinone biosynthesis C-methylase UbiE